MSTLDPSATESRVAPTTPVPPQANGSVAANGGPVPESPATPPPATEASAGGAEPSRVERAEQMVDNIAESVSDFTSRWGRRVVRVLSRIKEEAEDIWGEAQSIRRGDQP